MTPGGHHREPDALAAELTRPTLWENNSPAEEPAGVIDRWAHDVVLRRGKWCPRCSRHLPAEEFAANPRVRSGFSSWCKRCHRQAVRVWREEHRDEENAKRRAEYAAAHPRAVRHCEECGAELEGRASVVCSRRCKDTRYRRLHPEAEKARQARKVARRRARKAAES